MTRITDLAAAASVTGTEWLEMAKLSTTTITAGTISAAAADNSFNDSGSGFVTAGFAVNDRVKVSGFTGNTANNIFVATVTAVTAGKLTIGGADGDVIVDDAAGESVTITKWVSVRGQVSGGGGSSASYAKIYLGSSQATTGGFTADKVGFNTAESDADGLWDLVAKRCEPTVAGNYLVTTTLRLGTALSGLVMIYKNGARVANAGTGEVSARIHSGTYVVPCNGTTDYIEIYLTHGGAANALEASAITTYVQVTGPL